MTDIQRQAELERLEKLISRAKKKYDEGTEITAKIFRSIEQLGIDAEETPTKAENAETLQQAITCFLLYGEYSLADLMNEISAVAPKGSAADASAKKIRVYLGHDHVASVDSELQYRFRCKFGIVNYLAWVREQARNDYDIILDGKASIKSLKSRTTDDYWPSIGNWLDHKMLVLLNEQA